MSSPVFWRTRYRWRLTDWKNKNFLHWLQIIMDIIFSVQTVNWLLCNYNTNKMSHFITINLSALSNCNMTVQQCQFQLNDGRSVKQYSYNLYCLYLHTKKEKKLIDALGLVNCIGESTEHRHFHMFLWRLSKHCNVWDGVINLSAAKKKSHDWLQKQWSLSRPNSQVIKKWNAFCLSGEIHISQQTP